VTGHLLDLRKKWVEIYVDGYPSAFLPAAPDTYPLWQKLISQ